MCACSICYMLSVRIWFHINLNLFVVTWFLRINACKLVHVYNFCHGHEVLKMQTNGKLHQLSDDFKARLMKDNPNPKSKLTLLSLLWRSITKYILWEQPYVSADTIIQVKLSIINTISYILHFSDTRRAKFS